MQCVFSMAIRSPVISSSSSSFFLKSRKIDIHYTTSGRAFSNKNMRQGIALPHCRICLCTRVIELFTPFQWWFQKEQHSWGKASLLSSDQVAMNANQCHIDWNRSQLQACDSDWKVFSRGSPTWPSYNYSLYFKIQSQALEAKFSIWKYSTLNSNLVY